MRYDFNKELMNMLHDALTFKREECEELKEAEKTDYDLCKECGGRCCRNCGCHFSPYDFKEVTYEHLKEEIKKGYITIEWIDGDIFSRIGGCYILRVRNQGKEIVDDEIERSPCILLSENGCKLEFDKRPLGGKLLIPYQRKDAYSNQTELRCYSEYDIAACFDEWQEYQGIVLDLIKYFEKYPNYPCSI